MTDCGVGAAHAPAHGHSALPPKHQRPGTAQWATPFSLRPIPAPNAAHSPHPQHTTDSEAVARQVGARPVARLAVVKAVGVELGAPAALRRADPVARGHLNLAVGAEPAGLARHDGPGMRSGGRCGTGGPLHCNVSRRRAVGRPMSVMEGNARNWRGGWRVLSIAGVGHCNTGPEWVWAEGDGGHQQAYIRTANSHRRSPPPPPPAGPLPPPPKTEVNIQGEGQVCQATISTGTIQKRKIPPPPGILKSANIPGGLWMVPDISW